MPLLDMEHWNQLNDSFSKFILRTSTVLFFLYIWLFQRFAGEGLRTLCLAVKELDEKDFEAWRVKHHEASVALDNREDKLHDIYEEIERNMTLIGD